MRSNLCVLRIVRCTKCIGMRSHKYVQCTLYIVQFCTDCAMWITECVRAVRWGHTSMHCAINTVQCTLYIVQCLLQSVDYRVRVRSEMGSHKFRGSSHDPRLLNRHYSPIILIHKISSILLINWVKSYTILHFPWIIRNCLFVTEACSWYNCWYNTLYQVPGTRYMYLPLWAFGGGI